MNENILRNFYSIFDRFNHFYDKAIKLLEGELSRKIIFGAIILFLIKIVCKIIESIKKSNVKNKIKASVEKTKDNVVSIKECVQSMHEAGHLDINYFYKLPDDMIHKNVLFKIFFSVGISLAFPDEVIRKLLGKSLELKPLNQNVSNCKSLEIQLEKIEILANHNTSIFVNITNNTDQTIEFKRNKKSSDINNFIRNNIKFTINDKFDISYENTDSKEFFGNGQILARTTETIQFVFNKLNDRFIRRIEKVDFMYRLPKKGKPNETLDELNFSDEIKNFTYNKIEEHFSYLSDRDYELFLRAGGFLIVPTLILCLILFLPLGIGRLLLILNFLFFIFCFNLNYRVLSLIDRMKIEKNKDKDKDK